jgi:hypothetical protein
MEACHEKGRLQNTRASLKAHYSSRGGPLNVPSFFPRWASAHAEYAI